MKKILVTGGAGFVGANLCRKLAEDSNQYIYCIDSLITGRRENIRELEGASNFQFILHDVKNPIDLKVDEIYHAACPASPPAYQKSPTDTTKTCVYGMIHMLDLAVRYDAKILQFSTSEVYGDPLEHPQRETYWGHVNPDGVRSCYDEGKRCAEALCFDYHREYKARVKVIRIFNTYGPFMDPGDGRVVSNFIMSALKGRDLTIYGSGKQTRSFCYIDDLVEGIIRMMGTEDRVLGPVNLGNPGEFTLLELADKVLEKTGHRNENKPRLIHLPLPGDDPRQRRPDISLARELLGWEPKIGLDEGLERTIAYFSKLI